MRKQTYIKAKEFIDDFAVPIDYDALKVKVDNLSKLVCEDYGIKDKFLRCVFEDNEKFGKTASVSDTEISINKLRLEAITSLAFDDTCTRKLKAFLKDFEQNYNSETQHTLHEKMLYNFIREMREMDAESLVLQSGSYKTFKYEFLDIIFHENRHIVQKTYIPLLEKPATELKNKDFVLLFTMLYNEMRHDLIKAKKLEWGYQDNSIFPIEFDARYTSLVYLNNLRKLYYKNDKLFAKFIVRSCLVKPNLNSEKTAKKLFEEMEQFFSLGDFSKFNDTFALVLKNKTKIVTTLAQRFEEMKNIVKENKLIYN